MAREGMASRLITQAQVEIPEPVLGVSVVFIGFAPGYSTRRTTPEGFGSPSLLAVTETALHTFRLRGVVPRLDAVIGSWPWQAFSASMGSGVLVRTLSLRWDNGSIVKFKVRTLGVNHFQVPVIEEIVRRAGVPNASTPLD